MKLLYAISAVFFSVVAALVATGVTADPYCALITTMATTGGFICYAILDLKDQK